MQVARNAGLPVPRVICYGAHPDTLHAPVSILVTRVPGEALGRVYEVFSDDDRNSSLSGDHAGVAESMGRSEDLFSSKYLDKEFSRSWSFCWSF
ncbi:Aminoglycoside phosphotransferase [Penicillium brevicompactum]|uniref:Aminoglycoside phosphotransferase n=1 Tax=Penicillium brevicompactum TaxID=5074 RepID=A0A9W9R8H8_PENBR|nr:Aminoglycoside phosphotransferase [Penicillium brevicompactum]